MLGAINTQKYYVLAFVENSFLTKISAKRTKLDKTDIFYLHEAGESWILIITAH